MCKNNLLEQKIFKKKTIFNEEEQRDSFNPTKTYFRCRNNTLIYFKSLF